MCAYFVHKGVCQLLSHGLCMGCARGFVRCAQMCAGIVAVAANFARAGVQRVHWGAVVSAKFVRAVLL